MATDDVDKAGNFVLRGHLTVEERRALHERQSELLPWLASGKHADMSKIITAMLLGFGRKADDVAAAGIVTSYVMALSPLPIWAVERACRRFSDGLVKPDEIGAKYVDNTYAPSAANVAIIARAMVKPFGEEATRIKMTLQGKPPAPVMTAEERAASGERIKAMLDKALSIGSEESKLDEIHESQRLAADRKQRGDREIINGYLDAGLQAPVVPPGGVLVSLPMMMRNGYVIRTVKGRRCLLGPKSGDTGRDDE